MPADNDADRWAARALATLLRGGTAAAAVIGLIGGVKYLIDHPAEKVALEVFHGVPGEFRSVRGIIEGVMAQQGRAFIQLGVLVLVAVPILRVILSGIGFAREGDGIYVASSVLVLALLLWSLLGA